MKFRKFHAESGVESIMDRRLILDIAPPPQKEYPRFPRIALPPPTGSAVPFDDVLKERKSARAFNPTLSLSLRELGELLHAGAGLVKRTDAERARHHPSAGGLYPLEYYVVPYRVDNLSPHIFHYAVQSHSLEEMIASPVAPALSALWDDPVPDFSPAAAIILTAVWNRSYPKYGEFAYRLALLEAGHSAQDILLAAAAHGIGTRPVGSLRQDTIAALLDIKNTDEDPLYMVFLGR